MESPGFYASLQALERLKMRALEIPVHPQHGLDLDALEQALKRHPVKACWFMTSFQNPTGASLSAASKERLVALLASRQIPLIEDDVYGELYFGSQAPLPAKAFDRQGLVMHCSSFSKTLAPGYRVGWVAPGRFGPAIERLKLMTTLSASQPAQAALGRHFPAGIKVVQPSGGYFLWVECAPGFDTLALHQQALAQGISIAPGPMFSARQGWRHSVRLNYGHPWNTQLEAAMATLGQLAKDLYKKGL